MKPRNSILLAAAIVFVVANWIPFGRQALYPLTLFTTWVHEMGHGLTAVAVGGRFDSLEIFGNASGLADCYAALGWREAMVCLGGLLAPPLVGAVLIAFVHGPRRARVVLVVLAAAILISIVIYVRSAAGLVAMPAVAVALAWTAWRADWRVVAVQILGVILALDTLTRMVSYVFEDAVIVDGKTTPSDIQMVATNLGGHYVLWGIVVTVVAIGMLALASWWAWRAQPRSLRNLAASSRSKPASVGS